jgi:hypothetical protein
MKLATTLQAYTKRVDYNFRLAMAGRLGVPSNSVVTVSIKAGSVSAEYVVVGDRKSLEGKIASLKAYVASGGSLGGIKVLGMTVDYSYSIELPGSKPHKWASESAQKAWEKSAAETTKEKALPSQSAVRELNVKAQTHEATAKVRLLKEKTKEAKLKKVEAELAEKAAAKKQERHTKEGVTKAEKAATVPGSKSKKSEFGKGMNGFEGTVPVQVMGQSGPGDFRVFQLEWWRHNSEWLRSTYPALYKTLLDAKAYKGDMEKAAGSPATQGGKTSNKRGDKVWMRFLLDWNYAKQREILGYRYKWNADATYSVVRFMVMGCRRYMNKAKSGRWERGITSGSEKCQGKAARNLYSVSMRSVNNLCYPGVKNNAWRKSKAAEKACSSNTPVSVRLSRFRLVKPKRKSGSDAMESNMNGAPQVKMLRAYRSITPKQHYRMPWSEFERREDEALVGVQRVTWVLDEVVQYCGKPVLNPHTNLNEAAPYDEKVSWPRKRRGLGRMRFYPISVATRTQKNSFVKEKVVLLQTTDKRVMIRCRSPLAVGVIEGMKLSPTDTKCDIKFTNMKYTLACPAGKQRGVALQTSLMSRFDDASAVATSADGSANKVKVNHNKLSMKFQKTARLRELQANGEWQGRGNIPVNMVVSEPHWVPDQRYQSHRHYSFSFGLSDKAMSSISTSEIMWDPELSSHFDEPNNAETQQLYKATTLVELNSSSASRQATQGMAAARLATLLTLVVVVVATWTGC